MNDLFDPQQAKDKFSVVRACQFLPLASTYLSHFPSTVLHQLHEIIRTRHAPSASPMSGGSIITSIAADVSYHLLAGIGSLFVTLVHSFLHFPLNSVFYLLLHGLFQFLQETLGRHIGCSYCKEQRQHNQQLLFHILSKFNSFLQMY